VIGVASRIAQLSDRADITQRPNRRSYSSIIPLPEILAEIAGSGESSKKVKQLYYTILEKCGSEFDILLNHPLDTLYKNGGPLLAEAIRRMRNGEIIIQEGYDGEYGVIKVFQFGESKQFDTEGKFYIHSPEIAQEKEPRLLNFDLSEYHRLIEEHYTIEGVEEPEAEKPDAQLKLF
jgi:PHP family Zn ribbon phosphoesterase